MRHALFILALALTQHALAYGNCTEETLAAVTCDLKGTQALTPAQLAVADQESIAYGNTSDIPRFHASLETGKLTLLQKKVKSVTGRQCAKDGIVFKTAQFEFVHYGPVTGGLVGEVDFSNEVAFGNLDTFDVDMSATDFTLNHIRPADETIVQGPIRVSRATKTPIHFTIAIPAHVQVDNQPTTIDVVGLCHPGEI